MEITQNKKIVSMFDLKILGILLMFIDHIHEMFAHLGAPDWLDWFGRPVAVLFMFISVEGFTHTRNKKKYLLRLLLGSIIMNTGNIIVSHFFKIGQFALINNIFTSLFIGVLAMYGIFCFQEYQRTKKGKLIFQGLLCLLTPILISVAALLLLTSVTQPVVASLVLYIPNPLFAEGFPLFYLAPLLYLAKNKRMLQVSIIAVASLLFFFQNPAGFLTSNTQWMMIFSVIPILLYSGQKGRSMKFFFYAFYPVHIWLLYILASIIYNR